MVRGYFFIEEPSMSKFSSIDVLSKLDALKTRRKKEEAPTPEDDKKMIRNSFDAGKFYIDSFTTECFLAHNALYNIFKHIECANKDLIKVIPYDSEVFFISYNKFKDERDNTSFLMLLDELTRLSTFFAKENDDDECIRLLSDYINLCLSTPKTRNKNG